MQRTYTEGYRKLIAWQEAKKLTLKIYEVTRGFPREEQFHLVPQLRRAASSVMVNLAEGSAMPTKAHRSVYYARARASAVEVDNFIELSFALKYLAREQHDDLLDHVARVTYLIITQLMNSR